MHQRSLEATITQSLIDDGNPGADGLLFTAIESLALVRRVLNESKVERDAQILAHGPVENLGASTEEFRGMRLGDKGSASLVIYLLHESTSLGLPAVEVGDAGASTG